MPVVYFGVATFIIILVAAVLWNLIRTRRDFGQSSGVAFARGDQSTGGQKFPPVDIAGDKHLPSAVRMDRQMLPVELDGVKYTLRFNPDAEGFVWIDPWTKIHVDTLKQGIEAYNAAVVQPPLFYRWDYRGPSSDCTECKKFRSL